MLSTIIAGLGVVAAVIALFQVGRTAFDIRVVQRDIQEIRRNDGNLLEQQNRWTLLIHSREMLGIIWRQHRALGFWILAFLLVLIAWGLQVDAKTMLR